ncbi:MAG: RecX family transcriptional regulator [Candidatus Omnitrophica bacterium]|nr:RecX family transcriptional regulator [Candidatus Omnitrophota bacterium]MCM8809078.1 RecX family transcriptional regulator [Candidatus Omnitrophota bacterium]MCM8810858.1 RecX family transcriptional regulator [Candidatus Omnitrophota bacterium]
MKNKEIFEKVLKLISKKDYSEKEIIDKFPQITPTVLEKLKKERLIDDFSLCQKIVDKLKNKGKGYYYIVRELERRKIKEEIIEDFKKKYDFEEEFERCKEILKKLKSRDKNTILLNLKSKGYSEKTIERLLKNEN